MEHNNALNASCNFNGCMFCQKPNNTVEVEFKIKTTRAKDTLNKDAYCRTEKYSPWDRADRRTQIYKKNRTPKREFVDIDVQADSTSPETDIPDGEGFAYAPKLFTDPDSAATIPQTETDGNDPKVIQNTFISEYCKRCVTKHNRCWCDGSDLDEDLVEVELPKTPTNDQNNDTKQTDNLALVRHPPS